MATFDFISGEDFRHSLEADYNELNLAMQAKAWKAVHILAGSIIEAVLIDYLVASEYQKKSSTDPLQMSLSQAITACRQENVLSETTEHLSHAIRRYRNLIHPGRLIRLDEKVSENGATIAKALVETIVEEVAARRKQNYGYTAEQIITKLEHDSTAISILGHLLKDTSKPEMERLLLYVLPKRYFDLMSVDDDLQDLLSSLETCFRLSYNAVSEETKKKVAKYFVRALKEESSSVEWRYAFFRGEDLRYFLPEEASLVKQHFLSILKYPVTDKLLQAMEGIGKFLTPQEARAFVYPFINTVALYDNYYIGEVKYSVDNAIRTFTSECYNMKSDQLIEIEETLKREYLSSIKDGKDKFAKAEGRLYYEIFSLDIDDKPSSNSNRSFSFDDEEFP